MYGASALLLPGGHKLALLANIEGVLAEEELRDNPAGRGLTVDAYYDLVLAATGSESQARRRATAKRAAELRAASAQATSS